MSEIPTGVSELPTVSVVMPVLDGDEYVGAALDALAAQTLLALEVIVVDGGSSDGTPAIVRTRSSVTLLERPGSGVPDAHNEGVAAASGDLIAFAAHDDTLYPDALEHHAAAFAASPDADMTVGLVDLFADPAHSEGIRDGLAGTVRRTRVLEAVAVRRTVFGRFGGFREDLGPSADLEWVARLADGGARVVEVPHVVVRKRLHTASTTLARRETRAEIVAALRASIVRRRAP